MVQEKFNNKQMLLLTLLLVACLSAVSVSCRPSSVEAEKTLAVDPSEYPGNLPEETIRKVQQCEINQTTMELCM